MSYYTYTNAPVLRRGCFVDGRASDNRLASSSGYAAPSPVVVSGQRETMYAYTFHNPISGRFPLSYVSQIILDTTIDESGANGYVPESGIAPNQLGVYGDTGCQCVWLDNGSLVAIYRTRSTVGGSWSYWWRVNHEMGRQDTQPTITSGPIGNWSARVSISPATTDWIQIVRGQGRIAAIYNTGTMIGNTVSVVNTKDAIQYTRTSGSLQIIYALDSQLQTWSSPITVATGVAPFFGGLAYTGGEWVACYTRNSDLSPRVKRTANLLDWSAADIPMYASDGHTTFQTPDMNACAQNGSPSPLGIMGTSVMPPRPVHCLSLVASPQRMLNGVFAHYDDTPATYTAGNYNPYTGALISTYSVLQSYGTFGGIKSGDQGRTWFCPPALHSYSDCVTVGPGLNSGFPGVRSFGGGATVVDGYAWLNAFPLGTGGMSYLGWYESIP